MTSWARATKGEGGDNNDDVGHRIMTTWATAKNVQKSQKRAVLVRLPADVTSFLQGQITSRVLISEFLMKSPNLQGKCWI